MTPSLLSWQGRRTPGNLQASFHTKAQNVPAFLFLKMPLPRAFLTPASCIPHTGLVCALRRSPILSRQKPSTVHKCPSLPALDLDHPDLSFYPIGSLSPTICVTDFLKPLAMHQPLLRALSPARSIFSASGAWPASPQTRECG